MDEADIRSFAKTFAEVHLGDFDYMGIFELLEGEGFDEVSDEDAQKIYNLILSADVVLPE
jgi:hypothetical protein